MEDDLDRAAYALSRSARHRAAQVVPEGGAAAEAAERKDLLVEDWLVTRDTRLIYRVPPASSSKMFFSFLQIVWLSCCSLLSLDHRSLNLATWLFECMRSNLWL